MPHIAVVFPNQIIVIVDREKVLSIFLLLEMIPFLYVELRLIHLPNILFFFIILCVFMKRYVSVILRIVFVLKCSHGLDQYL